MEKDEDKKKPWAVLLKQPKNTTILLVGTFLIGILFFLANRLGPPPIETTNTPTQVEVTETEIRKAERDLEFRLEGILSQIQGAGQVEVSVFLATGTSYEYAINASANKRVIDEKDQGGGVRLTTENNSSDQYVLIRGNQAGQEKPVIIQETRPQIQGVLIVADGAKDAKIKNKLIRAVETALGLEIHRIQVLSREAR